MLYVKQFLAQHRWLTVKLLQLFFIVGLLLHNVLMLKSPTVGVARDRGFCQN